MDCDWCTSISVIRPSVLPYIPGTADSIGQSSKRPKAPLEGFMGIKYIIRSHEEKFSRATIEPERVRLCVRSFAYRNRRRGKTAKKYSEHALLILILILFDSQC